MRRKLDIELKAGIFIFAGMSLLLATILLLGGGKSLFEKYHPYYVEVQDAMGIAKGAMVRSGGIKIGRIGEISFSEKSELVKVEMLISEEYTKRIKHGSFVRLQTQGVLGDKFIEITAGIPDQESIAVGSTLEAEIPKDFTSVIASSTDVMQLLKDNLANLKVITGSLAQGKKTDILMKDMSEMASNLKEVTKQLKSGGAISELNQTMKNLNAVTEKVKNGEGTIGALFADASLYEDLKNLVGGANRNKVLKFFVRQAVKSTDEANKDKDKEKK